MNLLKNGNIILKATSINHYYALYLLSFRVFMNLENIKKNIQKELK